MLKTAQDAARGLKPKREANKQLQSPTAASPAGQTTGSNQCRYQSSRKRTRPVAKHGQNQRPGKRSVRKQSQAAIHHRAPGQRRHYQTQRRGDCQSYDLKQKLSTQMIGESSRAALRGRVQQTQSHRLQKALF